MANADQDLVSFLSFLSNKTARQLNFNPNQLLLTAPPPSTSEPAASQGQLRFVPAPSQPIRTLQLPPLPDTNQTVRAPSRFLSLDPYYRRLELRRLPPLVPGPILRGMRISPPNDRQIPKRGLKRIHQIMPYNTNAIPPRKEPTGTTQLPLSRVKKMIAHDPDINSCSTQAAFLITVATEMFIQMLAGKALDVAKSEKKPRRTIQYNDVAESVARSDNLEFLADIAPRTVKWKDVKKTQAQSGPGKATNGESSMEHGQTTLDGSRSAPAMSMNGINGLGHEGAADEGDDSTSADPNQQLEMENRGTGINTGSIDEVMNGEDVEMGQ